MSTTPQHFYADTNMNMRIADREGIEGVIVIAHLGGHYDYETGYDYDGATKPKVYASTEETR